MATTAPGTKVRVAAATTTAAAAPAGPSPSKKQRVGPTEAAEAAWASEVERLGAAGAIEKRRKERTAWAAQPLRFTFSLGPDEETASGGGGGGGASPNTATVTHTVGNLSPPQPTCEGIPFDPSDRHHRLARELRGAVTGGRLEIPSLPGAHIDFDIELTCRRADHPHVDDAASKPCWLDVERVIDLNHTFV